MLLEVQGLSELVKRKRMGVERAQRVHPSIISSEIGPWFLLDKLCTSSYCIMSGSPPLRQEVSHT